MPATLCTLYALLAAKERLRDARLQDVIGGWRVEAEAALDVAVKRRAFRDDWGPDFPEPVASDV